MPTVADLLRDSAVGKAAFGARYGEQDPYVLAVQRAKALGYPSPGASTDVGEAQRYMASKLAAERLGIVVPLVTNPLHEALLSWFAEGEGAPSLARLRAGYRGAFDAAPAEGQPVVAAPTPAPAPPPTPPPNPDDVRSLLAGLAVR